MQNHGTISDKKFTALVDGMEYKGTSNEYFNATTLDVKVSDTEVTFTFEVSSYGKLDTHVVRKPRLPFFHNDTPILFDTEGITKFGYNDGMGSRSCYVSLLIYCKNKVYRFDGSSIPGVAVIETSDYNKNGKWSSTSYDLALAAGWKAVKIQQGWNSGVYVDDVTSIKAMKKCLELDEAVSNATVAELVKIHFNKTWLRHQDYMEKMDALMDATEESGTEIVQYTFNKSRINKRTGMNILLLNDYPWNEEESDLVKIISREHSSGMGGGTTTYKLALDSSVTIEEVAECDPYGGDDDALEHRFYMDSEGVYQRIGGEPLTEEEKEEQTMADSPFAALKGMFK